jgi:hypothetical protein
MKYKVGDTVRIRSKEWMEAQEKNPENDSIYGCDPEDISLSVFMQDYAGQLAKIVHVVNGHYRLNIDDCVFYWQDWMFDPDYSEDGPMEAEGTIKAMLDGDTLYDREGNPRRFSDDEIESFMSLSRIPPKRIPPKRKRPMTRWEILDWANSEASRGWVVTSGCDTWKPPQYYSYDSYEMDPEKYRRARLLPDLSGVDEDTIQGFEAEEE